MSPPLIPGLAEELTAAARRLRHRRRRTRMLAAAAVVVVAAGVGVTATLDAPPAAAALDITERGGRVEVRLVDLETRPHAVEQALADAGIDADVVAVPVSPSVVGRFVSLAVGPGGEGDILPLDGDGFAATGFSIPAAYDGHLELTLGRAARPGEEYHLAGNALSAGEPLACLDLLGRPVRELARVAGEHPDLDITVRALGPGAGPDPMPAAVAAGGPYAGWILVEAQAESPTAVVFHATVDGRPAGPVPAPAPTGCD